MKDSYSIDGQKEKLIEKFLELVFLKAEVDSDKNSAYGISKYLSELLNYKISHRTLTRYYNDYIIKKNKQRKTPTDYNLNVLSEYLGSESFEKFNRNIQIEIEKGKLREEKRELQRRLNKVKLIGLFSSLVLLVISTFFVTKYFKKNCMIWVEDHYEKIRCSGLENEKKLDEVELMNFKKIEVCKDSIFFKEGEPVIHYTRHKNIIDFFTDEGEHPIYDGIYTNPITQTIIDSRVKDCDSLDVN